MQQTKAPLSSFDRARSLSIAEFQRRLEALCEDQHRELSATRARLEAWQQNSGHEADDVFFG